MYSYSVQYSLKSETKKTRELMLLSLAGTNCSTKSVKRKKKMENGYVYHGHRCKER